MPPELDEGQAETPAPETDEIPAAEAPEAEDGPEVAETPAEAAPAASEAEGEPSGDEPVRPNQKKTVEKLTGRIGHLTKTLHQKDEEIASERSRREALEALLNRGDAEEPITLPTQDTPRPGTAEFDRLVDERAAQRSREETFARDCNAIFDTGKEKHGADFEEAVTNLNALGMMHPALIEAAMATDSPADVIHALGTDVDEAARITALPPIRMAAEIVKLSAKLASPREERQVSRVPAPINPVGGQTTGSNDLYDPDVSMEEWVRRRKAQGSRFAR